MTPPDPAKDPVGSQTLVEAQEEIGEVALESRSAMMVEWGMVEHVEAQVVMRRVVLAMADTSGVVVARATAAATMAVKMEAARVAVSMAGAAMVMTVATMVTVA